MKGAFGKFAVDYEERINFDRLRAERLERAQREMEQSGVGILMTFDADNIRYLTSYYITTPIRKAEHLFCVAPRKGLPTFFGGANIEESNARMPWMKGRIRPGFGSAVMALSNENSPTIQAQVNAVVACMEEAGLQGETVGLDGTVLSHFYFEAFKKRGIKTVMAKGLMDNTRMVKTADEVNIMRIVASNTEFAFADIADAIRPGIREMDLVGIGLKSLYEQGIDHNQDLVCMSGYNTNPYNWTFTDKPVRPGDLVYIDVDGASYLGYKSCVYRTFCCGKATDDQKRTYDQALKWLYDGIAACKVGNTNYDIQRAFPQDPSVWGETDWSGIDPYCLAHGLGLTLHDRPFVAHSYMENKGPEIPLQAGMVLAVETYAGLKGGADGVRLEEMVLVTEDGPEVISKFPIDHLLECWKSF